MNIENLNDLINFCDGKNNNSFLFSYKFNDLIIRGIFFANSKSIIIGIESYNCAWSISIKLSKENLYYINTYIPNYIYKKIFKLLKNGETYSNEIFFSELISNLSQMITQNNLEGANDNEILSLLENIRFSTERYNKNDVKRPFFHYWRRVKPSIKSLNKIEDIFGSEIRQECYRNKITAVWSDKPTKNSLEFLTRKPNDKFEFQNQ